MEGPECCHDNDDKAAVMEHRISTARPGVAHSNVLEYCYAWTFEAERLRNPDILRQMDLHFDVADEKQTFNLRLDVAPADCKRKACWRDYLCIWLCVHPITDTVRFYTVLSICNREESASIVKERLLTVKSTSRENFHPKVLINERFFHRIASKEHLLDPENGFVIDGQFRIQCRVYFYSEDRMIQSFIPTGHIVSDDEAKRRLKEFDHFEKLLRDGSYSDVKLIAGAGSKKFDVHRSILSARSTFFAALFKDADTKDSIYNVVEMNDVDPDVLAEVLRFVYTGKVDLSRNLERNLFKAAENYQLTGLKDLCTDSITKSLTVSNVAEILTFADSHGSEEIMKGSIEFFLANSKEIMSTENFRTTIKACAPWMFGVINGLINRQ